jgi:hypothetical protein
MIAVSQPVLTDWSRVRGLRNGTEILLTVNDAPRARRYVLSVSDADLVVMKLTDPALPLAARSALTRVAQHPDKFGSTTGGQPAFRVDDLRVDADGVFLGGRKVAEIQDVYERVARERVIEIRQLSGSGAGVGAVWGLVAGGAVGLGNMLIKCGVNWRQETESCQNLEGAGLVIFPLFGLLIGGVAGAASGPAVIYRLPSPEPVPRAEIPALSPAATPRPPPVLEPRTPLSLTPWDGLNSRLQSGDPISVQETDGTKIEGRFSRASATSLRIVVGSVTREVPADRVEGIAALIGGNRLVRGLVVGSTIGAGLGALSCAGSRSTDQSWNTDRQSNSCPSSVIGGVVVLGWIGALVGAKQRGSNPVPVYSAPNRKLDVAPTVGRHSVGAVLAARF